MSSPENHESYATQSSSGISHDYYRKKGILFDKFSPQGEYLGAHTIKRKAYMGVKFLPLQIF